MVSNGVKETAAWKQFYLILDIESVHICRTTKLLFLLGEHVHGSTHYTQHSSFLFVKKFYCDYKSGYKWTSNLNTANCN